MSWISGIISFFVIIGNVYRFYYKPNNAVQIKANSKRFSKNFLVSSTFANDVEKYQCFSVGFRFGSNLSVLLSVQFLLEDFQNDRDAFDFFTSGAPDRCVPRRYLGSGILNHYIQLLFFFRTMNSGSTLKLIWLIKP